MLTVSRSPVSGGEDATRSRAHQQVTHQQVSVQHSTHQQLTRQQVTDQCAEALYRPEVADPLVMKVSECRTEREHALQLVQRIYRRAGLAKDSSARLRVMPQHLADSTDILVGKRGSRVVFTVSLVGDGEYGLPLESLFSDEVAHMRAEGMRLAEVSCLAHDCDPDDERGRFDAFLEGISLLLQVARDRGIDRLLLAVHPRHAKLYERLLGCVRCSDSREYAAVRGNPAVLCMHDFARLDQVGYPYYKRMYAPTYSPRQLARAPMSQAEKQYFEQYLPSGEYEFMPMAG